MVLVFARQAGSLPTESSPQPMLLQELPSHANLLLAKVPIEGLVLVFSIPVDKNEHIYLLLLGGKINNTADTWAAMPHRSYFLKINIIPP